jgi:predicted N-acetyltransferase YhbS
MPSLHKKMTVDEFHAYPRRLGWKHEYWDGELHLSPSDMAIATLKLELQRGEGPTHPGLRPVRLEDEERLRTLFHGSFRDAVEYADYPDGYFAKHVHKLVADWFSKTERTCWPASLVLEQGGELVGAIVIRNARFGPLVEPVFVAVPWQSQGLGGQLLRAAVNALVELGHATLFSRVHLGNDGSMRWHLRHGFFEIPEFFAANHRAHIYQEEAARLERLGDAGAAEARRLAEYWFGERERLHQTLGEAQRWWD